jgi:organic radical activating enzyme
MFNVKENKAICVLPWVHEFRKISGHTSVCCHTNQHFKNNETVEQVRELMSKGIKPEICSSCYKTEEESEWSPRIQETTDWINKFGAPETDNPILEYIDVRYDPTCNLKCKMCGPSSSTLWQKEKGIKIDVNKANKDYIFSVNKKLLKKVYLAGGEPTYIKDYLEFLHGLFLVNPTCEVVINSNLKKLPDAWKDIMSKFKNLTIICSCDATELLGTYVRYPLWWDEFERNVKFVSENANFLQFNLVAYNLTAHKLYETCTWMKKYSKNINLSILSYPKVFSEYAVPIEQRDVYVDNLKKIEKFPVSVYYAARFRNEVKLLIKKYSTSVYIPALHKKLQEELTEQDSHRSLKLQEVDTFLHSWIYA